MNTPTKIVIKSTNFSNRNAVCNGNERLFVIEDYVYSNEMALQRAAEIVICVNYHDRLVDKLTTVKVALEKSTELDRKYWARQIQQLLTEIEKSK